MNSKQGLSSPGWRIDIFPADRLKGVEASVLILETVQAAARFCRREECLRGNLPTDSASEWGRERQCF